MDSAASRIVKARQYAKERDKRIKVQRFEVELQGENANHFVSFASEAPEAVKWRCDCEEFMLQSICPHIMALEQILGDAVESAVMQAPSRMDAAASRVIKAKQYADERDQRIRVHQFSLDLRGENATHQIEYENREWSCDCEEFQLRGVCAHVMATEEILGDAVEPAVLTVPVAA